MTDEKTIRRDHLQVLQLGMAWYFSQESKKSALIADEREVIFEASLRGEIIFAHVVDLTTLQCPEPLMMLRQALRQESSGSYCLVVATDFSTTRDFKSFCQFTGHGFLAMAEYDQELEQLPAVYGFLLRKK